jgi:hypothetical protein
MHRSLLQLAACAALTLPAAAQIHVPDDYPNLQAAIDAAAPGDVIVVSSNTDLPVVIDKPLTIIGDPVFGGYLGCAPNNHGITLAGPGSGTVVLVRYQTSSLDCATLGSGIVGGGFDELHVIDSSIELNPSYSGLGHGNDAIEVDVPVLLVSGSAIKGKGSDTDASCFGFVHEDLAAGIRAPNSQVILLDSTVGGGATKFLCCVSCDCPTLPNPTLGGSGGPGVVADRVFLSNSQVTGGQGAEYLAYPFGDTYTPLGNPLHCLSQADGPDFVMNDYDALYDSLSGPPTVAPGEVYQLTTDGFFTTALFAALGSQPPQLSSAGWIFLDLASTVFLGLVSSSAVIPIPIPADASLLGLEFGFQALDDFGLTRPVFAVIAP